MGRRNRPFYRVCAVDARGSRDGKVIEYLGHYDPLVKETDARAILQGDRIEYWLSVGAQPTEKVGVLIKKYGAKGTHRDRQLAAIERLKTSKPTAPPPIAPPPRAKKKKEEAARDESSAADSPPAAQTETGENN
jgi:small subunit ribosomal protein S16